jgi:hypothetical protein
MHALVQEEAEGIFMGTAEIRCKGKDKEAAAQHLGKDKEASSAEQLVDQGELSVESNFFHHVQRHARCSCIGDDTFLIFP